MRFSDNTVLGIRDGRIRVSGLPLVLAAAAVMAAVAFALASAPSAQAHGVVDQSSPTFTPAKNGAEAVAIPRFEPFTPTVNNLTGVSLVLHAINQTPCPGDITVSIRSGSTGGPVLGQVKLNNFTPGKLPNATIHHFDFASPITLIPGNLYFIEASAISFCVGWAKTELIGPNSFQTFFEPAVGGDLRPIDTGGLPLETLDSSGTNAGAIAGVAAAIAAAAITLSGAAWYSRRRWVS